MRFIGELAALATSFFFAMTGLIFTQTGRMVMSHEEPPNTPHEHPRRGVIFGVLAGLGQAVGLVLSKQGMFGDFSPFQANAIRMLAAVIFVWGWTAFEGKIGATFTALRQKPQVLRLLALGALLGPLLGVSASLLAVQHAEVGVASTLMQWTKSHTFFCGHFPII